MNFRKIKVSSSRGKLRKEIGKIHLDILRLKRGDICEICGKSGKKGRFHILRTAKYSKLEFCDDNVLLTCWMPCHYAWHHYGPNAKENIETLIRIVELRGPMYEQELQIQEAMTPKHTTFYLQCLKMSMTKELEDLKGAI